MELVWNQKHLERPPNARWRTEIQKFDLKLFVTTLEKIITDLSSQQTLHTEAATLSRLIYRMKSKFRNDKGLKSMCKVNKAMLNYLSLSLEKEYTNLKSYIEVDGKYVNLPSKQMVEYVLARTQGFAKLMLRVEETARYAGHFFRSRMALGHAWSISFIAYSVLSRIWILTRILLKKCCAWYSGLYRFMQAFKPVGLIWMPKDQSLPSDITTWLAVNWINEPVPNISSDQQLKGSIFKLITLDRADSDEDFSLDSSFGLNGTNDINLSVDLENTNTGSVDTIKKITKDDIFSDDAGETISRAKYNQSQEKSDLSAESRFEPEEIPIKVKRRHDRAVSQNIVNKTTDSELITSVSNAFTKSKERKNYLTMDKVKTKSELLRLLDQESYPGLDKLRWNMIRNKSRQILARLSGNDDKKFSLKLKKIIRQIQDWIS